MNIIITGRSRSGKDSVANIIKENFKNVNLISLADPLKEFCSKCLGISVETLNALKNNNEYKLINDISMREYIINTSKQIININGEDFWVKQALNKFKSNSINVITDLRYIREKKILDNILKENYITIKIIRKSCDILYHDDNETELLEYDYCIENNGSLEDLKNKVLNIFN